MYLEESPELRVVDEFCFLEIDELFGRFELNWEDFRMLADKDGCLPHDAALRLLAAVELHRAPPKKLLTMLHHYREWYDHPETISKQIQGLLGGRAPAMADKIAHLGERRPHLVLR
jgi:hypothetical protein